MKTMKNHIITAALGAFICLSVSGAVSEDKLKDMKRHLRIDGVRDYEEGTRANERRMLRVEFSSDEEWLKNIHVRVVVELTDKKTKQVYFARGMRGFGELPENYQGEARLDFGMPCGELDKLKVTAYVVEFGVMDDGQFVPFEAECDHVKSYDELMERTAKEFPNPCSLHMMVRVSR